jgi:hypothetical protein
MFPHVSFNPYCINKEINTGKMPYKGTREEKRKDQSPNY